MLANRPTREEVPVRKPESLPLEWFDYPELETGSPEQFLAARAEGDATPGVPARSRYFRTGGQFTWCAACRIIKSQCHHARFSQESDQEVVGSDLWSDLWRACGSWMLWMMGMLRVGEVI